ncbi:MAG: sensor histidine kinase [Gordonia sp. (in: high G+C Gram-positive bacteria)]|uniref:sensor histidine kinase n=1 Tax=Gordonia sp. (in: high G+C Gram-positive bacteria) TaxID=84139 RepID=UPI003C76F411
MKTSVAQRLGAGFRSVRPYVDQISDPAVHRYLSRGRNWFAALLAVAMIAVCWPVLGEYTSLPAFLLPVFAIVGCCGLALLFTGPDGVRFGWAATLITSGVASLVPGADSWSMPIPLFLVLLVMTVAALWTQPLRTLPIITVATAGVFFVGLPLSAVVGWVFALVVVAISTAFLRYRTLSQKEIAVQTEATEVLRAREAVLAERSRIARDLHDIVAHRMSMVVVMAQTAQFRLAAAEPREQVGPGTVREFAAIADAARESLDEVRQLLGVLSPHSDRGAALAPVPGLDALSELVDEVRAIGVTVEFDSTVVRDDVAPAVGTAVYRIVQESITNATRHAPGAGIAVRMQPDAGHAGRLVVEVVNGGPTRPVGDAHGGGRGILGMTERALAVGGTLTAAPRPGGGFVVRSSMPANPIGRAEPGDPPNSDSEEALDTATSVPTQQPSAGTEPPELG